MANHFARFRTSASAESMDSVSLLGATSPGPTRCATLQGTQPRRLTLMWFQRNRLMVDWCAQRQLMASFEEDV